MENTHFSTLHSESIQYLCDIPFMKAEHYGGQLASHISAQRLSFFAWMVSKLTMVAAIIQSEIGFAQEVCLPIDLM